MSAHHTPTLPEVQANIDIVAAVLRTCQPGHQDIPLYQNMLNDLHTELANVRQAESSTMGATFGLRYHNRTMGNVGLSGRQIYQGPRGIVFVVRVKDTQRSGESP
jgi:DNA repair protein RadC